MVKLFPTPPSYGSSLPAVRPGPEIRDFLALRRSSSKRALSEPGPDLDALQEILTVAMRVPDHRRIAPWRFIVFCGDDRETFSQSAVAIQKQEMPDATETMLAETASALSRAPVIVGVVFSPNKGHKTPVWEQVLSTGAVCHNLLLAANASGWAGAWLTEWVCYSAGVADLLSLGPDERLAGMIYLGSPTADPQERMRATADDTRISLWRA
ncbi:MAG: nitroreductase [Pseudomonadota bacterium]